MTRTHTLPRLRLPIRAVTFDLDDTLYDFQACMTRSTSAVVREVCRLKPAVAATATLERFHGCWGTAADEAQARGGVVDWPAVRRHSIALLLTDCGCERDDDLIEELTALYFRERHAATPPFADAAAAIPLLAQRLPLGIISNANTRLTSLGLDGYFQVVITPTLAGCSKPDAAIFHHAATGLGCRPAEMLHVGDHWEHDVIGAHQAGCQAAWYCRREQAEREDGVPHLVVRDHQEMVRWLSTAEDAAPAGPAASTRSGTGR